MEKKGVSMIFLKVSAAIIIPSIRRGRAAFVKPIRSPKYIYIYF